MSKFMLMCICIDFSCKSPCSLDVVALIKTSISNTDLTSNSAVAIMHQELHHDAASVILHMCINVACMLTLAEGALSGSICYNPLCKANS